MNRPIGDSDVDSDDRKIRGFAAAAVACSNLLAATTSTLQSREPTPLIRA